MKRLSKAEGVGVVSDWTVSVSAGAVSPRNILVCIVFGWVAGLFGRGLKQGNE